MVDLKLHFPNGFFDEEVRCGYTVTKETKKLWAVQLDLLAELDHVCKKYDIKYMACAGTMLGAVRHQGFIPWDDDIDVMMTYDNYIQFLKVWKDTEIFKVMNFDNCEECNYVFTKIYDARTKSEQTKFALPDKLGVHIDVFCLYPIPSDNNCVSDYAKKTHKYYSKILNTDKKYIEISTRNTSPIKKVIKKAYSFYCNLFGKKYWFNKTYNELSKYVDTQTEGYTKPLTHISRNNYFPKEWFESAVYVDFEGEKYPVPVGYDEYLKQVFGEDYMIERKVPNHNNKFVWR